MALQHLCGQAAYNSTCTQIINQLEHMKDEIDRDNELLTNNTSNARQKRGAFNIVGNMANALFGVLDNEYAEKMSKTIDDIKQNEGHLISLLKNQTSIVDSTINIMKRDQLATKRKFDDLDEQLTQLRNNINNTGRDLFQQKLYQHILSLSVQLTLIVSSLQRVQSSIIDVLSDIRHGRISPLLLAPHQLSQEIITIRSHLPSSLCLPAEQNEILHLYQLMSVRGRVTGNHAIFQIKLPLVNSEGLELYKILPIPFLVNGTLVVLNPDSTYLAISTHRDKYYPLSEQEFSSCIMTSDGDNYLCYQQHPLYHKGADVSKCEIMLLNDSPLSNECSITKLKDKAIWIKTTYANQWIFALKDDISINAVCGNEIFTMSLQESGLLTMQPNCTIKHDSITIQGQQNYINKVKTSYEKLSHMFNTSIKTSIVPTITDISNYHAQWKELDLLKKQLSSQQLQLPKEITAYASHSITIGYIGFGLVLITIIYLITNFIVKRRQHQKGIPKPKPRRQNNLDFSINV